jgi:catechol 2,3-dioxygenase-like lactoylglutathione lyase family enzyme
LGATLILRDQLDAGAERRDYAILTLGGERMLLFTNVIFQDRVASGVAPGLTHAVYEVDDLDAEYERIKSLGAEVLIEPSFVKAGFGSRRLAFFRSPGGFVFEVMQILENLV